ncbi:MAG: hypothetical protein ACI4M9_06685, partial [Succinivibrio sp.]
NHTLVGETVYIKPGSDISYDPSIKGYSVRLPSELNNTLAVECSRYNNTFVIEVKEDSGEKSFEFDVAVDGRMVSVAIENQAPVMTAPAAVTAPVPEAHDSAAPEPAIQKAAAPVQTASKSAIPVLAVVIGFILLLLALLLAVLFFLGVFGSKDSAKDNIQESIQEQVLDEEKSDAKEDSNETLDSTVIEDNSKADAKDSTSTLSKSSACSVSADDDRKIISACLETKPDEDAVIALGVEAFEKDRCDLGKRILSSYGRRTAKSALTLARYYDENLDVSSSCLKKNSKEAVYWYKKARDFGSSEASDALKKFGE